MSGSGIIYPELKHRRKILINQLLVILEPNFRKKKKNFWNRIEILYKLFERKHSTIPVLPFWMILGMLEPLLWLCAHKGYVKEIHFGLFHDR
jgi:hypothetical protein